MTVKNLDLLVRRGASYQLPILWESSRLIYRPISAIQNTAPVRITAAGHGVPEGWLVAVANARGLTDLNVANNPPRDTEFRQATVIDADTIEINPVNAAGFKAHVAMTGQLVYYAPVLPVAGLRVRMQVKNKVGGTELFQRTTEDGGVILDASTKRIILDFQAADFVGAAWKSGVYDLEVEDANGVVTPIIAGAFTLTDEVTTI